MRAVLIAAAVAAIAVPAQAERFSALNGAKLVELCTGRDKSAQSDCTAYIEGISDTVSFYQKLRPKDGSKGAALPEYVCVPDSVTGLQLRETVVNWAKAHASLLPATQASGIVLRAINATYACPGEQRS